MKVWDNVYRETVYGIVKRLHFFIKHIEIERHRHQLEIEQIRILDIGCGTGINVTIPLALAGYSIVGLDPDRASLERARQIANGLSNVEFHCAFLDEMRFAQPFHMIICSEVLEHLPEPGVLVQQMQEVMIKDGLLLVTIPNGYGYFEAERFLEKLIPSLNRVTDEFQKWFIKKYGSVELKQRQAHEGKPQHWQLAKTSLAPDQAHYQKFTSTRIKQVLIDQKFNIIEFCSRTFVAGNILSNLVRDWDRFLAWNGRTANWLPAWLCSGWMIAARPVIHSAEHQERFEIAKQEKY